MSDMEPDTRVSVSLAQLRSELVAMELRIVDRLNGALANKADRAIQEQLAQRVADQQARLQQLEATTVKREGPIVHEIEEHGRQLTNLQAIAGYKKWLWAQTIALGGIAAAVIGIWVSSGTPT